MGPANNINSETQELALGGFHKRLMMRKLGLMRQANTRGGLFDD